jgi:hypothetical protein
MYVYIYIYIYIYIYYIIYVCLCVCVCVCERERERERESVYEDAVKILRVVRVPQFSPHTLPHTPLYSVSRRHAFLLQSVSFIVAVAPRAHSPPVTVHSLSTPSSPSLPLSPTNPPVPPCNKFFFYVRQCPSPECVYCSKRSILE